MQIQQYQIFSRSELVIHEIVKDFECPICLDTLFQPVKYNCQVHSICLDCVIHLQKCPLCRRNISDVQPNQELRKTLNSLQCKCPQGCGIIQYEDLYSHKINCPLQSDAQKKTSQALMQIKDQMIQILDKEINPHLKEMHRKIFDDFLTNWDWLPYKKEDWKWWWWSNTAWWNQQTCEKCNELWHKYEDEIILYENIRINLLELL
ncbi:unnamed protein product [Paramecium primaurelia]|uniref:RING-type domain-containing protein n=1 Tax=Paramecium primaurelia TaxID=5886 RepID=A0A8S1LCF2_PARPR|nr:unnamed protein product [Paramecium primaurelia]